MNDIKDKAPNLETIAYIEKLLVDAKKGELRTLFCICGWDDDSWNKGWSLDNRNTRLKFLGELSLAKAEIEAAYIVTDPDSQLSQAITKW